MSADLPAVRASDISLALASAPDTRWFVPDRSGVGTTMLGAPAGSELRPAFGSGSGAAHLASGAVEVGCRELARLRLDVDTVTDLTAAVELGVGRQTAAVLTGRRWQPQGASATREAG
jgi:2-phospho-L-lactate guanylyltransferase